MKIVRYCKNCGNAYPKDSNSLRFCSDNCEQEFKENKKNLHRDLTITSEKKPDTKLCLYCNKVLENAIRKVDFCDYSCRKLYLKKIPLGEKLIRNCLHCKKPFAATNLMESYCSTECTKAMKGSICKRP